MSEAPGELTRLLERASAWASQDSDPVTRDEALECVARRDLSELRELFATNLEFGTAGLRALVGPGPARMNAATVRKAAFAVGSHLTAHVRHPLVVLAYDGRESSLGLATECAGVLVAQGVRVAHFAEPAPTPLAAFAIRHLRADAGIVVTASHNPKAYNGFKLYASDGCQIIPPVDADIAQRMATAAAARDIRCDLGRALAPEHAIGQETIEAYHADLRALYAAQVNDVVVAYTALHGVGGKVAKRAFEEQGVRALNVVPEQQEPDPEFPTVAFPNPEEPGVMDRVIALAQKTGADVALATDPDADRLGVAVPDEQGAWLQLSGNQIGLLLAFQALSQYAGPRQALVVQSVVSSPMLRDIAGSFGARYERTLTGFKWICRPALALPECHYVMGYEEALGYAVSASVLDKDGVSAAVKFVELVARCKHEGTTVLRHLFQLYRRFGLWVSVPHTLVLPGVEGAREMVRAMDELRRNPPRAVLDVPVTGFVDYRRGADTRPPWLGATNLVELELGDKGRILVRPSGTEPKLKIYVDYRGEAPTSWEHYAASERALSAECRRLAQALAQCMGL